MSASGAFVVKVGLVSAVLDPFRYQLILVYDFLHSISYKALFLRPRMMIQNITLNEVD